MVSSRCGIEHRRVTGRQVPGCPLRVLVDCESTKNLGGQSSLNGLKQMNTLAISELTEHRRHPKGLVGTNFCFFPTPVVLTSREIVGSSIHDAVGLIFLFYFYRFIFLILCLCCLGVCVILSTAWDIRGSLV